MNNLLKFTSNAQKALKKMPLQFLNFRFRGTLWHVLNGSDLKDWLKMKELRIPGYS
jgi:hypothetical protein